MRDQRNGRDKSLKIIQFTDTHFFGKPEERLMGVDTAETFKQVFELATTQHGTPDFYLLTGDLSQDETQSSYERLAECLKNIQAPAYYLPGNHDRRGILRQAFADCKAPIRADLNFIEDNWNIILLDTLVESEVRGHLSDAELSRLDQSLTKNPSHHTLIALHHHPVPVGCAWMDDIGVDNAASFLDIVDRHKQVRGILWGHIHQEFDSRYKDVKLMATPSTCVQFKPNSSRFAADAIPPGYRWIELSEDGQIQSGVERVAAVARGLDLTSAGY